MDPAPGATRPSTSPLAVIHRTLHRHPTLSPSVVLAIAAITFTILNDRFIQPGNLSLVLQQVAVVGALAAGQTLIILTAGIDLSVGSIMILSQMVMANLAATTAESAGMSAPLALLVGFALALAAGFLNGALVTRLKLPPFIVTLGTMNIWMAVATLYTGGESVSGSKLPSLMLWTGESFQLGGFNISYGVLLMLAIYAIAGYSLRSTAWGRHVYAVGDDPDAARLAGIRVSAVTLSVYAVAGLIFGIAAWILIGRVGSAGPNAATDANLDSITAVVIGGTSLFGGRGKIVGSLLGAITVGVFRNGLSLANVDVYYQTLTVGVLVIAAVGIDQWIRRAQP